MSLKLVRRPKSPNWIIRGTLRGIRIEESTGVADRRAAEEIRAKREAEVLTESVYGRRAVTTFGQAALSYLETGGKRRTGGSKRFLTKVMDYFDKTPLAQIDQDAIDKGARKLYPKASPATRNRQFYTPAAAVIWHAARRGWCERPVIGRPEPGPERVRWLTHEEADRLIAACNEHLRPLVIFLLYTGARAGEALWLDWADLDLLRAHVTFHETKNGRARGVPLHRSVVVALSNLSHRDGPVFRRPDGMPYERPAEDDDEDTSAGTRIKKAFNGACRRAGITDFHPHDCRHTWASWHYQENRDLTALQALGGWLTPKMVMRYAHANKSEFRAGIDRLPGKTGGNLGAGAPSAARKSSKSRA